MEKYLSGQELVKRWDIEGFQLLEIIRDGLQSYSKLGLKVLDKDAITFTRRESIDDIFKTLKIEQGAYNTQFIGGAPGKGRIKPKLTDDELREKAKGLFEKQPLDVPVVPQDCIVEDLHLPVDENDAASKIQKAMSFRYRLEDVQKYDSKYFPWPVNETDSPEKISPNENYPALNIGELKHCARKWAMNHPCIRGIYLYRFALLNDSLKYLLITVGPESPSKEIPKDENAWTGEDAENYKIVKYYNWADYECAYVRSDIEGTYKDGSLTDIHEWMLRPITLSEVAEIEAYDEDDPYVDPQSGAIQ